MATHIDHVKTLDCVYEVRAGNISCNTLLFWNIKKILWVGVGLQYK